MRYILLFVLFLIAIMLFLQCCGPTRTTPNPPKKDTSTGHWEYYNGTEDMRWVPIKPKQ